MDKKQIADEIAAAERELSSQLKEAAANASAGVVIAHRIDELRATIDRKRAALRCTENADRISGRRSAGNPAGVATEKD